MILRPENGSAQVREIVRIAARYSFPIYPVSSGKNWGYLGSRVPSCLRRQRWSTSAGWNPRITGYDERLGAVTVQPGVTQRDLFCLSAARATTQAFDGRHRARARSAGLIEQCDGAAGFGHTSYGDHFANVCGLEVVLPNGEIVRTGHAGLPNAKSGSVYRWGAGPSLDGIFSQSNYGIVTEMTVWLMPAPERFEAFFFQTEREDGIAVIVDVRPSAFVSDGSFMRAARSISRNDYKVIAGIQ